MKNNQHERNLLAWIRGIAAILAVQIPLAAYAVDGVVEINQACAVESGCMNGDTAGFPVTISEPGSYRLTGNLTLADENVDGIEIITAHVIVDLNGFSILGPVECTGMPVSSCTPTGTGRGIYALNNANYHHIAIRNGFISGVGDSGIAMSAVFAVHVEGVRLASNGDYGIRAGLQAVIKDCVVESNGSIGVSVGQHSRILNTTAMWNDGIGISASANALIQDSLSTGNDSTGVNCSVGCLVDTVVSRANNPTGISAGDRSIIQNSTATANAVSGITCGDGCLVRSSTAADNTTAQLVLSGESGYVGNVLTGASPVSGVSAVELGSNLCNGDTTCP